MQTRRFLTAAGLTLSLAALVACQSGPPSIKELKVGKDKDVSQAAAAFDTRDTIFAVANIDNPPDDGKVVARLAVVEVEGQQPGVIPGLETTLDLGAVMNTANVNFSAPTSGWPNGKYQLQVILLDKTGAQKDQKNADFTTSGNQPAAAPVDTAAAPVEGTDEAGDAAATETAEPEQ